MKTFIAYRSTGEDPVLLEPMLTAVRDGFRSKGIDAYCTFFDEQLFKDKVYSPRQILEHAFKIVDACDFLFVLQTSDNKSEGMLMEIGYTLAKGIPVIAAVKDTVKKSLVSEVARVALPWADIPNLVETIQNFEFEA